MFCLRLQLSGYQIAQMLRFLSVIILPFQNFSVSSLKGFICSSSFINLFKCISQTKRVGCFEMSGSGSRFENRLQNTIVQGKEAGSREGRQWQSGRVLFPRAPVLPLKFISPLARAPVQGSRSQSRGCCGR